MHIVHRTYFTVDSAQASGGIESSKTIFIFYLFNQNLISNIILSIIFSAELIVREIFLIGFCPRLRRVWYPKNIVCGSNVGTCIQERGACVERIKIIGDTTCGLESNHIPVGFVFAKWKSTPHLKIHIVKLIRDSCDHEVIFRITYDTPIKN